MCLLGLVLSSTLVEKLLPLLMQNVLSIPLWRFHVIYNIHLQNLPLHHMQVVGVLLCIFGSKTNQASLYNLGITQIKHHIHIYAQE